MTVSSTLNRISYNGNDVTVAFAVSFPFQAKADLVVLSTVILTGVQTTKALTTDYTISGSTDTLGFYSSGGTVTFLVAPASTVRITIYRDPARTQGLDLVASDSLPAESTEAAIDYQTMLIQRVADLIGRSLRQPDGDSANIATLPSAVDRASKLHYYDANGDPSPIAISTLGTITALPLTGGTLLGNLTISATIPALNMVSTHVTSKRTSIGFSHNATTLFGLGTDLAGNGTQEFFVVDFVAGVTRLLLDANGCLSLVAGQLKFPATQNPSADANTLDDYEEGTWTPSLGGNATYTSRSGSYTKIGNRVFFDCNITVNVIGTGSTYQITGLPIAATGVIQAATVYLSVSATNIVSVTAFLDSTPTISLAHRIAAAANTSTGGLFGNGTIVYITGSYQV